MKWLNAIFKALEMEPAGKACPSEKNAKAGFQATMYMPGLLISLIRQMKSKNSRI